MKMAVQMTAIFGNEKMESRVAQRMGWSGFFFWRDGWLVWKSKGGYCRSFRNQNCISTKPDDFGSGRARVA